MMSPAWKMVSIVSGYGILEGSKQTSTRDFGRRAGAVLRDCSPGCRAGRGDAIAGFPAS
jgi:hypothetical protein